MMGCCEWDAGQGDAASGMKWDGANGREWDDVSEMLGNKMLQVV